MAYIGKEPQFTQYPSKFFDGDNSAMTVTLDYAPPNDAALLVFIDGVRQDTDAYNLVGTSLTFTGAVPTGTNNVQVVHMGLTLDVGVPGDATITAAKLASGVSATNITAQNTFFKNWNAVTATQTTTIASSENAAIIGTPAITVNNGVTWTIVGTLQLL